MPSMTIKKGDTVLVLSGRDKGKKGTVEKVFPLNEAALVSGVNIIKRHLKPSQQQPRGAIIEKPAPIDRSNLMVVCPHCSKPTRVQHTVTEQDTHRTCQHCKGNLDSN